MQPAPEEQMFADGLRRTYCLSHDTARCGAAGEER